MHGNEKLTAKIDVAIVAFAARPLSIFVKGVSTEKSFVAPQINE